MTQFFKVCSHDFGREHDQTKEECSKFWNKNVMVKKMTMYLGPFPEPGRLSEKTKSA
jgi:hypothetical protein